MIFTSRSVQLLVVAKAGRCMRYLTVLALLICTGCGMLPDGRRWGQDATFTPGLERITQLGLT